mmetsp:Transcript_19755/g.41392  ORF Transcript_19755/g.41392 Transcript_19755/m.41392 type:complete len:151 (-) Transcript_19755:965-1417(-)
MMSFTTSCLRPALHQSGLYVVGRGTVPQTKCSINDHTFTILPFTSASGGVVCCVVIFTSNNNDGVPILWKAGVNLQYIDPFPLRVAASPVRFLSKYWNKLDLFPRTPNGPIPMLVVDGHQSHLDPGFITYINDPNHEWKVCFGVPFATVP